MPGRNSLKRRKPRLDPRPRVLIVCEGSKTEPRYFEQVKQEEAVRLVEITIEPSGGVPKTVVAKAVELKKDAERDAKRARDGNLRYDEVWCVFDVDEHPHLHEARDQARAHGIQLAVSNPCFELWFLLHFQDQRAFIHRHDAQRICRDHMTGYRKEADYAGLRELYPDAVARAEALDEWQEGQGRPGENPSTGVYRLTERLRQLSGANLLRRLRR